ncbi:MAG: multicopper oxidase type 3 [Candidatus Peregrinibacteria bacterium Greene0416_19]|nr:MAG: multicopper oxidase type 3 [Candidatus Peregrinibacteria bacterium Greene0416_19]
MKYRSFLIIGTLFLAACAPTNFNQMGGGGMMGGDRGGMMQGSFLPARDKNIDQLPEAKPMSILEVKDGETITLNPELVRATIVGRTFALYAYNGQFPGPTLKVKQGSTFTVNVTNNIDVPTTIHWHGIRLENRFDGAAGVTQEAIQPGESFSYTVKVPDEGMFWYHPHVREDLQQDMGLYGGLWVTPKDEKLYSVVNREEVLMLDDILLEGELPVPYGEKEANHALMGRFGNTMLINGTDPLSFGFGIQQGTVRLYLINAANTRTFRFQVRNMHSESLVPLTLVGGDGGRYEREQRVSFVTLSPSERAIVDVRFDETTTYTLEHGGPGDFQYALGTVVVDNALPPVRLRQDRIREHADIIRDIDAFRPYFDKPVDKTIHLSVESMPARMMQQGNPGGMQHGSTKLTTGGGEHGGNAPTPESDDGIEWEDPMPQVNAMSTKHNTQWKLIDEASAKENMDIAYQFKVGDKVKIRLVNDGEKDGSDHPMQHPIHFHGQRFLVLAVDGKPNENLVWKDTVLVTKGTTVVILLEVTNPGDWMFLRFRAAASFI